MIFQVAINGEHYTEFRHRIPINRIDTIAIDGEVQLFAIKTEIMRAPSPNPQTIGVNFYEFQFYSSDFWGFFAFFLAAASAVQFLA